MKTWSTQDAKARFSEMLDTALTEGPQMVTRRGVEAAVLVPATAWRRLQADRKPTLKELLLAQEPRGDVPAPQRGDSRRRPPTAL
ncbi:MAG: type II toxin-antitoxin system Phd/YefM family antitoxin [Proteobacteria bacterium]|nr:type II toxin-antitoxin system Phd/YefM family antitoxin [Pseudomonadota bacterium]MDA1057234.1 type II toxin-antitoxin system Phd/YefM family antitoxin [Pseudomonadota bacterium]